jgi:hypothetical protein
MIHRYFQLALIGVICLNAQISGPMLGYAESGGKLRPILGVPGAAFFGDPLDLEGMTPLAWSAEGRYVLAAPGSAKELRIISHAAARPSVPVPLESVPVWAIVSPHGSAAALTGESDFVEVITGLPDRPVVARQIRLDAGQIVRAMSDDGQVIAVVEANGAFIIRSPQGSTAVAAPTNVTDLRFLPGTHDVLYTDSGANQVALVRNAASSVIAGAADGITGAFAAAIAGSGKFLVVTDAAQKQIFLKNIDTGEVERTDISCVPSSLERLNDSTLRAGCDASTRTYLIDIARQGGHVLFIPEPVE